MPLPLCPINCQPLCPMTGLFTAAVPLLPHLLVFNLWHLTHLQAKPPDKGSFPLDHHAECKDKMTVMEFCWVFSGGGGRGGRIEGGLNPRVNYRVFV